MSAPRRTRGWRGLVALLGLALAACGTPVRTELHEGALEHRLTRVAVVPFELDPAPGAVVSGDNASRLVSSRVAEALMAHARVEVVPPEDVGLRLQQSGVSGSSPPRELGRQVREAFGADGLLLGRIRRYQARRGGSAGVREPAGVWFEVELRTASGSLLWSGDYDETQRPLSEDPGSAGRASARGFQWVTAEALARYGADELMRELSRQALP